MVVFFEEVLGLSDAELFGKCLEVGPKLAGNCPGLQKRRGGLLKAVRTV
jgi:hypothetical protein